MPIRNNTHVGLFMIVAAMVGSGTALAVGPALRASSAEADAPTVSATTGVVARALAATFAVHAEDQGAGKPIGAAFRDAATGLIATNAHVVGDARRVELAASDGRRIVARVVARDESKDLAALSVETVGPGLDLATDPVLPGAAVYAVGSPLGLGHSVTRGIVSAASREFDPRSPSPAIQHDAALNPGSSGGPLVDEHGRAIGLNSAMPDGFRRHIGIGYALPAPMVARFLADVAAGRPVGARVLGLNVRPIEGALARALGGELAGLLIEEVVPGEAAERAGLRAGDVITGTAGQSVDRAPALAAALDAAPRDRPIALTIRRGGGTIAVEVVPTLPPELPGAPHGLPVGPPTPPDADALGLGLSAASDSAPTIAPRPGSPAEAAGLQPGETVLAVGLVPVRAAGEAMAAIAHRPAAALALLVASGDGSTRYVLIDPDKGPVDGLGERGNIRARDSLAF